LDDASFRSSFSGSPIKRIGRNRFIRNVLIAAGNSGDSSLLPQIEAHLADQSPLVRAMAVWALGMLSDAVQYARLRGLHLPFEADAEVRSEWFGQSDERGGQGV
jgi:epoxyqueuosine reductase